MLSKKHNDPLYWKNKLEALDSLPVDTTAEKNTMWDKLHSRLQQKPAGNKPVWYWIAAALFPFIIIVLTMANKTETMLVKKMPEKTINNTFVFTQPASGEAITLSVSAPVEKKQALASVKAKIKAQINYDTIKENSPVVTITALPQNQVTEITGINTLPPDTTASIAITKKKLPVIHINELESFPAQFNVPVNYAQSIKPSKNKSNGLGMATGQNIIGFKIKLSSKN